MYPSSTSSSSQGSMGLTSNSGGGGDSGGLMRYGSAPGSILTTAADSVIGRTRDFSAHSQLGPPRNLGDHSTPVIGYLREEPTSETNNSTIGLQRARAFNVGGASPSLVRHSSSPAGLLDQLSSSAVDSGFSVARGIGNYSDTKNLSRLNSQLSFTRQENTLSHISEENESTENGLGKSGHAYGSTSGFSMATQWNDPSSVIFSMGPNKRAKLNDELFDGMENQFRFSMAQEGMEMANMDKLMHIPQDSVPCKIRAKRGCATHPRSIAERERRTRISGKLKKLQILVPNMDKQTSYSDMLDLAVQHIKSLQDQVQNLNQELENCKCGCKASYL